MRLHKDVTLLRVRGYLAIVSVPKDLMLLVEKWDSSNEDM